MKVTKPVKRETGCLYRGHPLMVEVHERHIEVWRKGEHTRFSCGFVGLYERAAAMAAEMAMRERRAEQAMRKAVR